MFICKRVHDLFYYLCLFTSAFDTCVDIPVFLGDLMVCVVGYLCKTHKGNR